MKCNQYVAKGSKAHSVLSKPVDVNKTRWSAWSVEDHKTCLTETESEIVPMYVLSPRSVVWYGPLCVVDEGTLKTTFYSDSVLIKDLVSLASDVP